MIIFLTVLSFVLFGGLCFVCGMFFGASAMKRHYESKSEDKTDENN